MFVTVDNHWFLAGDEVFHPMVDGDKEGRLWTSTRS